MVGGEGLWPCDGPGPDWGAGHVQGTRHAEMPPGRGARHPEAGRALSRAPAVLKSPLMAMGRRDGIGGGREAADGWGPEDREARQPPAARGAALAAEPGGDPPTMMCRADVSASSVPTVE